ncbi:MAG: hypothetical protein CMH55_08790 [Myxococcales bacterium]|nr:hypothetical protein [Myxococcales bacterium]
MGEKSYFFSHLLGEHYGHELKLGRSSQSGYTLCVYTGAEPNAETDTVLHLNLRERTGMHDSGMSWQIQANDHERVGHAWDDNMPDSPPVPYPFEDWVLDQLQWMITRFVRFELRRAIFQIKDRPPKDEEGWRTVQSLLLEAERRMGWEEELPEPDERKLMSGISDSTEEEAWEVTLGLARCALELGDVDEVKRRTARFTDGYFPEGFSCLAMCNKGVQELLPPLIEHDEAFWAELMPAPMAKLHAYEDGKPYWGDSARRRFFEWLRTVKSPKVMAVWVDEALKAKARPDRWFHYAALIQPEPMAQAIIRLIDGAMDAVGETTEHLFHLLPALRHQGQTDRAEGVAQRLESLGFSEEVRAWQMELRALYWTIAGRSTRTVAFEHLDTAQRLLELEDQLNSHWHGRPQAEWPRHIKDTHFVCVGTLIWIALWRTAEQPKEALDRIQQFFSDGELLGLLHSSDTRHMEELIDSACIALIETGRVEQARDLLVQVMTSIPPTDNEQTHYNYACIFARCGDVEQVIGPLTTFLRLTEPDRRSRARSRIKRDPDFDGIREAADFKKVLRKRFR